MSLSCSEFLRELMGLGDSGELMGPGDSVPPPGEPGSLISGPQTAAEVWKWLLPGTASAAGLPVQSGAQLTPQPLPLLSACIGPFKVTTLVPSPLPASPREYRSVLGVGCKHRGSRVWEQALNRTHTPMTIPALPTLLGAVPNPRERQQAYVTGPSSASVLVYIGAG